MSIFMSFIPIRILMGPLTLYDVFVAIMMTKMLNLCQWYVKQNGT